MPSSTDPAHAVPRLRGRALLEAFEQAVVNEGLLSAEQIAEAARRAETLGQPLDRYCADTALLREETVLDLLSRLAGIPVARIADYDIRPGAVEWVPVRTATHYGIMPIRLENGVITIATSRVREVGEEDSLRMLLGFSVRWVLCSARDISESIRHFYGVGAATIHEMLVALSDARGFPIEQPGEPTEADDPAIATFVRQVLQDAIEMNATDVHFEPLAARLRLRYRVDGVLYNIPVPEGLQRFKKAVVSCIKVMAELDIAEKRLPHDGRIRFAPGDEEFDLRVSVLPTRFGESANLRILNRKATFLDVRQLGLDPAQRATLDRLTQLSHGLVLITGPTGSGKTTTLYATLARINRDATNIITLEDPVEYEIEGINQIQMQPGIGLTFAAGLRSILRHDPDVILVGEIRDSETADITIRSALTGHLVFSTLHTNDSAGAVTRLLDMGIEPYLVASSLEGIVAQRLTRRICDACRAQIEIDNETKAEIRTLFPQKARDARFFRGRGCPDCRFTGYSGRSAIFETLIMNDPLRAMVVRRASGKEILREAVGMGLRTLRASGWARVLEGITTVDDVLRVTREPETESRTNRGLL